MQTDTGTNDLCMFIDQRVDRDCDLGLLHVSFSSADFGSASNQATHISRYWSAPCTRLINVRSLRSLQHQLDR
jgi:hypothetical protein